jgi:uncharacterized protein (TIGR03435 family)
MRHIIVAIIATTAIVGAQTPPAAPAFEVASIKPNKSGDNRVLIQFPVGGRFTATGVTVRNLIAMAYGVPQPLPPFRIIGGPSWIGADRFDIIAKTEIEVTPGPGGPLPLMLRGLLADRFKLVVHNETRELPIFELVMAKNDGKLGPKLNVAAVDCAAIAAARGRGGPPPPETGTPTQRGPQFAAPGRPMCGMMVGPANSAGGGQSMAQIATLLSGRVGRTVVDRTGLTGNFDLDLSWTPDQMPPALSGAPPPGAPPLPPIDPNGPSIFTALQEQLGLKLESTKGPVDVVVIDSVEPPTAD